MWSAYSVGVATSSINRPFAWSISVSYFVAPSIGRAPLSENKVEKTSLRDHSANLRPNFLLCDWLPAVRCSENWSRHGEIRASLIGKYVPHKSSMLRSKCLSTMMVMHLYHRTTFGAPHNNNYLTELDTTPAAPSDQSWTNHVSACSVALLTSNQL